MLLERGEDPAVKHEKLIFLLAIAGRLDAQARLLPQYLDKQRSIYHVYAFFDALSSSLSLFRFLYEIHFATNDKEQMHQFTSSPEGIALITSEVLFLVTFSVLASLFENEKADTVKKNIEIAWRYFRDFMKGLKNSYRGTRGCTQIISLIGHIDLKYTVIPLGLAIGVIAVANRWWLLNMREKRKAMMKVNEKLLAEILNNPKNDSKDCLARIAFQTEEARIHAFLSMALGGFVDGLNLYVGVLTLAILSSTALLALSLLSGFYIIVCVISRIYEEYEDQVQLLVTQNKCKLALLARELEELFLLKREYIKSGNQSELEVLERQFKLATQSFKELNHTVKTQITRTYCKAALLGLKYGLGAYGVLNSCLFIVPTLLGLSASLFPPVLLIVSILMGVFLMIGFMTYMLSTHYLYLSKQSSKDALEPINHVEESHFYKSLNDGVSPKASSKLFFQECSEAFRSFFSGLAKGENLARFLATAFQNFDAQDHQHDAPLMLGLRIASAGLFGLVLALRALAKGFKAKPRVEINLVPVKAEAPPQETMETEALGESCETIQSPPDSPPNSPLVRHSIFNPVTPTFTLATQTEIPHNPLDTMSNPIRV